MEARAGNNEPANINFKKSDVLIWDYFWLTAVSSGPYLHSSSLLERLHTNHAHPDSCSRTLTPSYACVSVSKRMQLLICSLERSPRRASCTCTGTGELRAFTTWCAVSFIACPALWDLQNKIPSYNIRQTALILIEAHPASAGLRYFTDSLRWA